MHDIACAVKVCTGYRVIVHECLYITYTYNYVVA